MYELQFLEDGLGQEVSSEKAGVEYHHIERSWDDAKYGRPSNRPMLELTIPTMYDASLAPAGKHIMGIFLQYAPYTLREGTWDELHEPFYNRVVELTEEYNPTSARSSSISRC